MIIKTNGYLEEYIAKVNSGEIIAGLEIKQVLDRLAADLAADNVLYDTTKADLRIDLIEKCLRQTKEPYYNKPFNLLLFQKAFISALYGFKLPDYKDKYQKALLLIARKNGKSALVGALLLAEMIIGGMGLDIIVSSNTDQQCNIIFDDVCRMASLIDPYEKDLHKNLKGLHCLTNENHLVKLSDRVKQKEGLNLSYSAVDEIHEMHDNTIIKSIEQSMSLKDNPKLILITTTGFVNGYLDNELERARSILAGEATDRAAERYLPFLYTQDSEKEVFAGNENNRLWEKSNPTIGVIKKYDYLIQQVDLARSSAADRAFVLNKDFNLKQSNAKCWLNETDYKYTAEFDISDFTGSLFVAGVDLSETTDLSSIKVLMLKKDDDYNKYIISHFFIPETKLQSGNSDKHAGAKYSDWQKQGLLTVCSGNYIDTSIIADWIYSLYVKYKLRPYKIGYDTRFAADFVKACDNYGLETEVILQKPEVLSNPLNKIEADLKSRYIFGLNEIDHWNFSNASLHLQNNGLISVEKIRGRSGARIDGIDTLADVYYLMTKYKDILQK